MTPLKIIAGVVVAVIAGVAIYGAYQYPKLPISFGAPAGSTFTTAKVASVKMDWTGGAASSTSILNTDSGGRWYSSGFTNCTQLEAASTSVTSFIVQAATTSVANEGLQGNTNLYMNLNVGTTSAYISPFSSNATTTKSDSITQGYWPAGTYLTFLVNAVSTTSDCVVGVNYIAS